MRLLKNFESDTLEYSGNIEGLRILVKYKADSANTPLTKCAALKNVIIDWKRDNEQVYSGDLATLIQYGFFRSFDSTGRMAYLNDTSEIGQMIIPAASGVYEERIADFSINFPSQAGNHSFFVRMNECFDGEADGNSQILFDFDKSDDVCTQLFRIINEPVQKAGNKNKQIIGNVENIIFVCGDNKYIPNNASQFNNTNNHPIENCSINSKYAQCNYCGEELQVLEICNTNGFFKVTPGTVGTSVTTVAKQPLQKTVRLTDREVMVDPEVDLKLDVNSLSSSVDYTLVYDLVTYVK